MSDNKDDVNPLAFHVCIAAPGTTNQYSGTWQGFRSDCSHYWYQLSQISQVSCSLSDTSVKITMQIFVLLWQLSVWSRTSFALNFLNSRRVYKATRSLKANNCLSQYIFIHLNWSYFDEGWGLLNMVITEAPFRGADICLPRLWLSPSR